MNGGAMSQKNRERNVFYVMGFDPRGISVYYGQLKRQARLLMRRDFSSLQDGSRQKTLGTRASQPAQARD
jgi:hypothetical protein